MPCLTTIDAWGLAELFLREVVHLHGLPLTFISDWGAQFPSIFWQQIWSQLGIDLTMSMAFYPQTDGQTERINASMEHYLRVFINHQQDDWVKWLLLTEFAANDETSETTKRSPFYAVPGMHPWMTFAGSPTRDQDHRCSNADQVQATIQHTHEHLRVEMRRCQAVQREGCKGRYACVRPHRYMYENYRNTVANVDASNSRCRCKGKIIGRDLRLVVSRLYKMAVTRPGSRAAIRVSPSLGADLLGCKSQYNRREWKGVIKQSFDIRNRTNLSVPQPISTAQGDLPADPAHGETPPPIDWDLEMVKPVPTPFILGRDPQK